MTKKLILRVDPQTHRQILERARTNINAAKEWSEQIQAAIDECDHLYAATSIAQYRARKRVERDQKAISST
jgi:multidrug resistance efflux pump